MCHLHRVETLTRYSWLGSSLQLVSRKYPPPLFCSNLTGALVVPIFSEAGAPVLGPAHRPATGALVHEIMQQHHLKALFVPPSIVEQLLQEPGGQENFQKLEWIAYTGGPLSPSAGDLLSKFIDICPFFGVTETLPLQQLVPLREDWPYIEWHPCRKIELQPSEDDAYELVVFSDDSTERTSGLNHNFPDKKEWRTKDLFKPHPKKPNLWRFHGRLDDIVVLSNGEKFNPVPIEALVQGHPVIMGALVVGQGRFQAALLVEPQSEILDRTTLAEVIWPVVERANRLVPSHGQITQSKIAVASIDKPFQRAGKGTVIRRLTERDYAAEIAALYESDGAIQQKATPILPASFTLEEVKRFVRSCTKSSFPDVETADHDDLFVRGLDSLKTLNIAAMLKSGLRLPGSTSDLAWLSEKTLYSNPTIDGLSYLIYQSLNPEATSSADEARLSRTRQSGMAALVEKYTQDLPVLPSHPSPQPSSTPMVVALTGTTGSLGTHLFQTLHSSPTISKIYCLNRAHNAQNRHFAKLADQGFKPGVSDSKAVYLTVNFSDPIFGLEPDVYAAMSGQVDVIVHNAWQVGFKHALSSYESVHIRGLRHLISWSTNSARSPRIVFISSVSAAANWAFLHKAANDHSTTAPITITTTAPPVPVPVPETHLVDYSAAAPMGYGESKHVAERILAAAHARSGVPITVLRVGQIAGSTSRADPPWPAQEWVPALVRTSKALRVVPGGGAGGDLPPVDWIPINKVAAIIVEILLADRRDGGSGFYNLVHPRPVQWEAMVGPLREGLGPGVAAVEPLTEWIDRLAKFDGLDQAVRADKPALALLDLFRGFAEREGDVAFETTRATGVSETMAALEPISPALMKMWLEQWGF